MASIAKWGHLANSGGLAPPETPAIIKVLGGCK